LYLYPSLSPYVLFVFVFLFIYLHLERGYRDSLNSVFLALFEQFIDTSRVNSIKKLQSKTMRPSLEMERLEQELRYFRQELANERDPFLQNILLGQIRDCQEQILHLLQEERKQAERENKNLQDALNWAIKMKKQ
jgi:hypothetical protein